MLGERGSVGLGPPGLVLPASSACGAGVHALVAAAEDAPLDSHRHLRFPDGVFVPRPASVGYGERRMTTALSIFLKELKVSAGTPKTADNTRGGSLLTDSPMPMLSLFSGALVFWMIVMFMSAGPRFSK